MHVMNVRKGVVEMVNYPDMRYCHISIIFGSFKLIRYKGFPPFPFSLTKLTIYTVSIRAHAVSGSKGNCVGGRQRF